MMKTNLSKFYTLLVGAGYDKKMFLELLNSLEYNDKNQHAKDFERIVVAIRNVKKESVNATVQHKKSNNSIVDKMYSLLILDGDLNVNECLLYISNFLCETYPERIVPVINSKKGFRKSMLSLTRQFTDSELLHIASRVKNKLSKNNNVDNDWILKE